MNGKSCKHLTLAAALLLFMHIAHTQCRPAQHTEFYNDYLNNHDAAKLKYQHQYYISDLPSRLHILHCEQREGDYVHGTYSQLEPTGQLRSVYYEVNGSQGYRAIVAQRTAHSRVHQSLHFERKQPTQALPLARPVAFVT